jgi:ribose transport system substrate-binding protein
MTTLRKQWPIVLAAGLVVLLLALAGCGGDDDDEAEPAGGGTAAGETGAGETGDAEPIRVAVFLASAANTYWQAELEGAMEAAEEAGNVEITSFDGEFDTNRQKSQLQDALVSGQFDAWFVGPNEGAALVPEITQALGEGIPVACTLVPCGPDIREVDVQIEGMTAFIGVGFYENGQDLGELTLQACEGKDPCKVVWLPGLPSLPLEQAREEGLRSVLEENDSIEIVATQGGGYLAAPALEATQNILQANPDAAVIVSSGDQMIVGAERAVRLAGKEGQIALIGNGATTDGVQAIGEDRWFGSAVYLPRTEGRRATELLIQSLREEPVEGMYIDPLEETGAPRIITQDNVDEVEFEPEFEG